MVLLLCMIFLTAMMLLGLSASADTILQNKLAANLQQAEQVKQSAQTGLEAAERWLIGLEPSDSDVCTPPCDNLIIYAVAELPADLQYQPLSWWLANGQTYSRDSSNPSIWLVELLYSMAIPERPDHWRSWYRITARGSDPTDTVVSVVESIVVKTWSNIEASPSTTTPETSLCSAESGNCRRVAWNKVR